jgi:K+-transporting ATPase ATPase C chain
MGQKTVYTSTQNPTTNDQPGGSILGHIWASIGVTIVLGIVCCGIYPAVIYILGQAIFPVQANGSLLSDKKDGSFTTDDKHAIGSSLIGQVFIAPQYFHSRPSAANNSAGASYSSTGGYDPTASGGTNYGPLNDELINGQTIAATTQPTTQPEKLAYDGVRLRTIHYAVDNGIAFKLYTVAADGSKTVVPVTKYQDSQGNLNDMALVDAFPHNGATAGLIAADFATLIPGDAVTASGSGLDPHISPANAQIQAARVAAARKATVDQVKALIDQYTDGRDLGILGDPGVNVLRLNIALDNKFPMPPAPTPAAAPATQPAP